MDNNKGKDITKLDLLSEKHEISGSCRVCLSQSANMRDIFDVQANIIGRIEYCTGVKVSQHEGLPSLICDSCLTNLSVAHNFKTTCITIDERLQRLVANVKVEVDDDYCCEASDDDVKEEIEFRVKEEVKKEEPKSKPQIKPSVRKKADKEPQSPKKKPDPHFCDACQIKFKTKKEREEHNRKLHRDCLETFICEICGKVFIHRASLFSHARSHLPPQFACAQCDYATWHKHDLAKHVLIHNGIKRYQCEYCTASYYTSSNLSSHIRRFHERLKPHSCHLCDRKFYDTTKLNRHLDSHNDVKRFECEVCHSCFTRRCYWKKHLQRQHNIVVPAQRPGKQKVNLLVGGSILDTAQKTAEEAPAS